jgi:hypothetical protein
MSQAIKPMHYYNKVTYYGGSQIVVKLAWSFHDETFLSSQTEVHGQEDIHLLPVSGDDGGPTETHRVDIFMHLDAIIPFGVSQTQ